MLATPSRRARFVPALLLATAAALPATAALATPLSPSAVDLGDACADESGVTVVVDATELEGDVTVGCAPDPATGTEALAQAGIPETRDPSGLICAIGGLPDPCPTEFTGSYWTYWTAAPGGEWTAYGEGPDTAVPAAGTVEGWRYGDGTQPPAVAPADVLPGAAADDASAEETSDDAAGETDATTAEAPADDTDDTDGTDAGGDGMSLAVGAAVGIAVVGGLVGLIVRLRRQSRDLPQD